MITVAIVALCTLLALAPPRRPFALGALSFLVSFAFNELPFTAFAYLAFTTWLALDQNDSGPPAAVTILSLAAVTAAGLAVVTWRGLRAGPAVAEALLEGLGGGCRFVVGGRPLSLARIVFAPVYFHRRDVRRVANIRYGDAGRKNLLDVYCRRDRPPGAQQYSGAVLVHLHGGALVMGKKNRDALPLLYRLASQGWVCVSANYRLRPAAQFPDYLIDVKKVIAWVRENAHEYGADPAVVFIAGTSAGGQLAALAALTPNKPGYQPGFEHADTSVTGAICLNAYYGEAGDLSGSSPLACDVTAAPPFFVAHGDRDSLIPVSAARAFAARLRAGSANPVVYAELPGAQHGFDRFHSLRFAAVIAGIEAFTTCIRDTIGSSVA